MVIASYSKQENVTIVELHLFKFLQSKKNFSAVSYFTSVFTCYDEFLKSLVTPNHDMPQMQMLYSIFFWNLSHLKL